MRLSITLSVVLSAASISLCAASISSAQGVSPKLVICGGGSLPDTVYLRFLELAGPSPSLVFIPTASQRNVDADEVQKLWRSRGFQSVSILHSTDRDVTSSDDFAAPLKSATAVWFGGGSQQRIADAYLGTPVEEEVYALVRRGGVVGGTSAGAAIQSRVMIAGGKIEPAISTGFDLLPDSIVDQHFLKRNRMTRLVTAIRAHPHRIGIGIDESTALIVHADKAEVVGRSYLMRVQSIDGSVKLDSFGPGDVVPVQ